MVIPSTFDICLLLKHFFIDLSYITVSYQAVLQRQMKTTHLFRRGEQSQGGLKSDFTLTANMFSYVHIYLAYKSLIFHSFPTSWINAKCYFCCSQHSY